MTVCGARIVSKGSTVVTQHSGGFAMQDSHSAFLGSRLSISGEFDAAVKEFRETLRIDPHNANARNNLGLAIDKKMVR
jgi:Flp pilus assembly protein TadD